MVRNANQGKTKQLERHTLLADICQLEDNKERYRQLAYDDKMYLIMLKYSLKNEMEFKDENIGWCADK